MNRTLPAGAVLTVTPNPALDGTYTVHGIVPGQTHRVKAPTVRAGGKGANVARVIHQLGYPSLALAPCGGVSGAEYAADLTAAGVPHVLVPVTVPTRRSIALVDDLSHTTSIFNEEGAPLTEADWGDLNSRVDEMLPRAGCIVGSGSLPPDAPEDFYPRLALRAARLGIPCVIDTSGPALLGAAEAGALALKPNHHELREATGESDLRCAARSLIARGAQLVFVSCGEDGMFAFCADEPGFHLTAALPQPLRGNPTGAGDAAVAAIAVLLARGCRDTETMLRLATGWSAAAVLMPAAGEIHASHQVLADSVLITRHNDAGVRSRGAGKGD